MKTDPVAIGYKAAAQYLGIMPNTLSAYCTRGNGPIPSGYTKDGQYNRPVFPLAELDRWRGTRRPGKRREVASEASEG